VSIAVGVGAIFYSWVVRIFLRVMQYLLSGRSLMAVLRGRRVAEVSSGRQLGGRSSSGRTLSGKNLGARAGSGMAGRTGSGRVPSGNPARVAPAPPPPAGQNTTPVLPAGVKGAWN
jgi:hypothetical protein